ncbi:MAG: hypothetical protein WBQ92_06770, partial [Pseudomonas alloputida]
MDARLKSHWIYRTMTVISLETLHGNFEISYFEVEGQQAVLIKTPTIPEIPFIRIHSSCVFSEAFHANDCDCALQLNAALDYIKANSGIIVYLFQEGRGVGLDLKIQAIALEQSEGINTSQAYKRLGLHQDPRVYPAAIEALKSLDIKQVAIGTNNPNKKRALEEAGIQVAQIIDLEIPETPKI